MKRERKRLAKAIINYKKIIFWSIISLLVIIVASFFVYNKFLFSDVSLSPLPVTATLVNKILAPDNESSDYFGKSVSISGDYLIVGAPYEDTGGTNVGAAYIFKKNLAGQFELVNKIQASDKSANSRFGTSVSISGDYAVVAPYGTYTAYIYIFKKNATGQFNEIQKYQEPNIFGPQSGFCEYYPGDTFGKSVSISGDNILIGSMKFTTRSNMARLKGVVFVLQRNPSDLFELKSMLEGPSCNSYSPCELDNPSFGDSVSISGDYLIIGEPSNYYYYFHWDTGLLDYYYDRTGTAIIFKKDQTGYFSQVGVIQASDEQDPAHFGYSVSISGDYVIVGTPNYNDTGSNYSGAAYIFKKNAMGQFVEINKLQAPVEERVNYLQFGYSVSISGDYAVVGADDSRGQGYVYIFKKNATDQFEYLNEVRAYDYSQSYFKYFGKSSSIDGNYTVLGAAYDREGGSYAGAAYVYKLGAQDSNLGPISEGKFIFQIETNSSDQTFSFRTYNAVNLSVDWGDGRNETYNWGGIESHTYSSPGVYNISLNGQASGISFSFGTPLLLKDILTNVSDGIIGLNSSLFMFEDIDVSNFTCKTFFDTASKNVTDMSFMFLNAKNFNQDISNWDTSKVTDMTGMFEGASSFNQPLNNWNTSQLIEMNDIFFRASSFNQPLNNWKTAKVTDMTGMFDEAKAFNQPLNNWNTSKVTDMSYMFHLTDSFNQNISNWDISNVINMHSMFAYTRSFNQPIGNWNVSKVTQMDNMFSGANLSISNYDNLLNGWAGLPNLKRDVKFNGGLSKYCFGRNARNTTLIGIYNWNITDNGKNETCGATSLYYSNNLSYGKFKRASNFTVNITLTDDFGLDSYWIESNHSGIMTNYTYHISGISYNVSQSYKINLTKGDTLSFKIYFNDSFGNINSTDWTSLSIINNVPLSLSIPNQEWLTGTNLTLNLSNYFVDADMDNLIYSSSAFSNLEVIINQATGIATLIPNSNFNGMGSIRFSASDLVGLNYSNDVTLTTFTPILIANSFGGQTTNFTSLNKFLNVNITLENSGFGLINFSSVNLNKSSIDLDSIINISRNHAEVNSTAFPGLNVSASITLVNLNFTKPFIKREGVNCTDCIITYWNSSEGKIIFYVPHFTSYEVGEQPNPINPNTDPVTDPPRSSGSPSGGNSCSPNWSCSWSSCIDNIQRYVCNDTRRCNINSGKPIETNRVCNEGILEDNNQNDGSAQILNEQEATFIDKAMDKINNFLSEAKDKIGDLISEAKSFLYAEENSKAIKITIILLAVIIVLIILILIIRFYRKKKRKEEKDKKIQKAKEFVVDAQSNGWNLDLLRQMFREKGWKEEDIKEITS